MTQDIIMQTLAAWAIIGLMVFQLFKDDWHPTPRQKLLVLLLCGPLFWFLLFVYVISWLLRDRKKW